MMTRSGSSSDSRPDRSVAKVRGLDGDIETLGAKAFGLLALPDAWVPPFRVLPVRSATQFSDTPALRTEIRQLIAADPELRLASNFMVRSSSPSESLNDRGRLRSLKADRLSGSVAIAAEEIARHAQSVGVLWLGLIIQVYIDESSTGHLSNERRVSSKEDIWLLERHLPGYQASRLELEKRRGAAIDEPLSIGLADPPLDALTNIARWFTSPAYRVHVEWVADRHRLWVVQVDHEQASHLPRPLDDWILANPPVQRPPFAGKLLVPASAAGQPWGKARDVRLFESLGLPHGDVHVIEDPAIIESLSRGDVPALLDDELRAFCVGATVVRTDVIGPDDAPALMLPRSDCIETVEGVERFLCDTAVLMLSESAGPVAFLVHRFTPALAGAFAYASPRNRRVRIDATWGVPDSLSFYSHDTYEVDLADVDRTVSRVRCKDSFVDVNAKGEWIERQAGWDWDWKRALTSAEVRWIAEAAHQIAVEQDQPTQVMFFVGTQPETPPANVLPWYTQPANEFEDALQFPSRRTRIAIRSRDDLAAARKGLSGDGGSQADAAFLLRPTIDLIRSNDFVAEAGQLAASLGIPVILEGSALSHAFYILRQQGAAVVASDAPGETIDPRRPAPLNKLVRDRIPEIVQSHFEDVEIVRVHGEELRDLLTRKAVEESIELASATSEDGVVDELADLFEVVRSTAEHLGIALTQIETMADEKRAKSGGFSQGIVVVSTQEGIVGEPGMRTDSSGESHVDPYPGHPSPSILQTKDALVLHVPYRALPVRRRGVLKGVIGEREVVVRVGHHGDGFSIEIGEPPKQQPAEQLALELFGE